MGARFCSRGRGPGLLGQTDITPITVHFTMSLSHNTYNTSYHSLIPMKDCIDRAAV